MKIEQKTFSKNIFTLKLAQKHLNNVTGGDAIISKHPKGGYSVKDSYREGIVFSGKNPREAVDNAGFTFYDEKPKAVIYRNGVVVACCIKYVK